MTSFAGINSTALKKFTLVRIVVMLSFSSQTICSAQWLQTGLSWMVVTTGRLWLMLEQNTNSKLESVYSKNSALAMLSAIMTSDLPFMVWDS
jgi:predicted type IV restriction endonuclease